MYKKSLSRKVTIDNSNDLSDTGNNLEVTYFLLETPGDQFQLYEADNVFGIEISLSKDEGFFETEIFNNVFTSRNAAEKFINKLADNVVTPVSLKYILEDSLV